MAMLSSMGSFYGVDVFMSHNENAVGTVWQKKKIRQLEDKIQTQSQKQSTLLANMLDSQIGTTAGTNCVTTGSCSINPEPYVVKKDTKKIKNLIAYYYKR